MTIYQQKENPLFPELLWDQPQSGALRPKILLIGGNKDSLTAPLSSFQLLKDAANIQLVLPDFWEKTFKDDSDDIVFCPSTPSGSLSNLGLDKVLRLASENDLVLLAGSLTRNSQTKRLIINLVENISKPIVFGEETWGLFDGSHQFSLNQVVVLNDLNKTNKFFHKFFPDLLKEYSTKGSKLNLLEIVKSFEISRFPLLVKHNNLMISRLADKLCYTYSKPMASQKDENFQLASWSALYVATNPQRFFESLTTACWQLSRKIS